MINIHRSTDNSINPSMTMMMMVNYPSGNPNLIYLLLASFSLYVLLFLDFHYKKTRPFPRSAHTSYCAKRHVGTCSPKRIYNILRNTKRGKKEENYYRKDHPTIPSLRFFFSFLVHLCDGRQRDKSSLKVFFTTASRLESNKKRIKLRK